MIVYLNGHFVPEANAVVSIHDRGFLYGDGLFETVRIHLGKPFLWREHMERFTRGAEELGIHSPLSPGELLRVLEELLARNHLGEAVARLTLTRGVGPRGYSPRGAESPTQSIALFPAPAHLPEACRIITSRYRLPAADPLGGCKHANKLVQVLARAEADAAGADEAILLNSHGHAVEGTSTNLFWIREDQVCTAPLEDGVLAGVTRACVLRLARENRLTVCEEARPPEELERADGLFLTSSGLGIMEVSHWNAQPVRRSRWVGQLKALYRAGMDLLK